MTKDAFWNYFNSEINNNAFLWIGRRPVTLKLPQYTSKITIKANNPIPLPLHIIAVEFYSKFSFFLPENLKLSVSDFWDGNQCNPDKQIKEFVGNIYGPGIHTKLSIHPFIELSFEPIENDTLFVIYNRDDLWAWRNEWILVEAFKQNGDLEVLFNPQSIISDFIFWFLK